MKYIYVKSLFVYFFVANQRNVFVEYDLFPDIFPSLFVSVYFFLNSNEMLLLQRLEKSIR